MDPHESQSANTWRDSVVQWSVLPASVPRVTLERPVIIIQEKSIIYLNFIRFIARGHALGVKCATRKDTWNFANHDIKYIQETLNISYLCVKIYTNFVNCGLDSLNRCYFKSYFCKIGGILCFSQEPRLHSKDSMF